MVLALQAQAKIELVCVVDDDVPVRMASAQIRRGQVLRNLVGNATKFTDSGEVTVHVSTRSGEREVVALEFEMRDTGTGFLETSVDKLISVFAQVDASTTRRFGRTGLGPATSKQSVERMGATIRVVSPPGRGSVLLVHRSARSGATRIRSNAGQAARRAAVAGCRARSGESNDACVALANAASQRPYRAARRRAWNSG